MTLEQYLIANPTATLANVQAYTETTDKKKVGSGQARGYFAGNGLWLTLKLIQGDLTHPMFSLVDAVIATATDAASFFGLDTTTAAGQGNIAGLDALVSGGVMTATQKAEFLSMALTVTTPFANVTQAEIDAAKALTLLKTNPIINQEVSYTAGSVHVIPSPNQKVYISITVLQIDQLSIADNLIVTAYHKAAGDVNYTEVDTKRGNFNIPANFSGKKAFTINHSNLLPHVKLKITSKFNRVFTANAYTA